MKSRIDKIIEKGIKTLMKDLEMEKVTGKTSGLLEIARITDPLGVSEAERRLKEMSK